MEGVVLPLLLCSVLFCFALLCSALLCLFAVPFAAASPVSSTYPANRYLHCYAPLPDRSIFTSRLPLTHLLYAFDTALPLSLLLNSQLTPLQHAKPASDTPCPGRHSLSLITRRTNRPTAHHTSHTVQYTRATHEAFHYRPGGDL
ncbi:hypothetical protein K431DRAFT_328799 [Polychaeton citri CBS 116435]|uniref:Secreted protein n=1 Tax=Polychaeton citri CBS 116435 TaxID=1314669 RepID=A0A9P4UP04_9PEZI|nr:hypothetical protein K431DRAFT_328799 [Polychaeton citri CBS 116435]